MNLDIIPNGAIKRVHVSQNDVGRTLTFELFNGSTQYTIPVGATVKIQGTKPSGFGFSETCTVSGNTVTVDTTEEMTDEYGYIETELQITYSGNTIGTSNFVLAVERNPHPDTTTDGSMETIIPELTLLVNEVKGYAEEIEGTYHAYGSPWVASTVSEMTDTDKIYVYTGSESGYTNGNWYYYNGSAWVSGGVYNAVAVQTDKTLTLEDVPAEAKATGTAIEMLGDGFLLTKITETIVQGVVYTNTDPYTVATNPGRLVMSNPEALGATLFIKANGQKYTYMLYDSSGTYLGEAGGWITTDRVVNVGKGNKIRLQYSKLDNSVITVDELKVTAYTLVDVGERNVIPYFASGAIPSFDIKLDSQGTTVVCTFPANEFRLYLKNGSLAYSTTTYNGSTFTIANGKKLAYNALNGEISVVDYSQSTSLINLLSVSGEAVSGLLSGFYETVFNKQNILNSSARCYISGPSEPIFSILTGSSIKVTFPSAFEIRIYWAGAPYVYSATANESYTLNPWAQSLVYNTSTGTIYAKTNTNVKTSEILLFSWSSFGAYGLFAPYFNASTTLRAILEYRGKIAPALYCQRYNSSLGYVQRTVCDAKIAFISDIHKSQYPLQAMLNFTNQLGTSWFDVIVNGGDTVSNLGSEGLDWYDAMVDTSVLPILNCVGNHDTWYDDGSGLPYEQYSATETYQLITKKVAQTANIVQPANAETNGYNYYYKDINNVRVIVLDIMNWDSTQNNWLISILSDALTQDFHVMGVVHGPFLINRDFTPIFVQGLVDYGTDPYTINSGNTSRITTELISNLPSTFTINANGQKFAYGIYSSDGTLVSSPDGWHNANVTVTNNNNYKYRFQVAYLNDATITPNENATSITGNAEMTFPNVPRNSLHPRDNIYSPTDAVNAVYDFINNGGHFVCWLSGHTHADEVGVMEEYGNQFWVAITTPRDGATDTPKSQNQDDFTYTAFDCIGVDTVNGTVKFQRVGADTNWNMVKHDKLCIDYVNKTILS